MQVSSQTGAIHPRKRLWRLTLRAATACILGLGILYAWEILAGPEQPTLYRASGRVHVNNMHRYGMDASLASTVLNTHVAVFNASSVQRNAALRVSMAYPELSPVAVQVVCRQRPGSTILEISGIGSEPRYVRAYINEAMSEYLAHRKTIQDARTAQQGQMLHSFLSAGRDVGETYQALNSLPTSTSDAGAKAEAELQEGLEEAEDRHRFWRELVSVYYSDGCFLNDQIGILEAAGPAVALEDKLDPRSIIMRHPWRAIASLGAGALLAMGLIPVRRRP